MKAEGATTLRTAAEGSDWATWISYPEEAMARASHVLAGDGELGEDASCWLIDPVDASDLDEWLADRGEVAGVVVLLDRHTRDADAIARRHDVAVHVPTQLADVADEFTARVVTFDGELADTGYRTLPVVDRRVWHEVALSHPDRGTLVVPEAVGTAEFFRTDDERLGVHPALRLRPPRRALGGLAPDRICCGHGEPVEDGATAALHDALAGARRSAPRLYAGTLRSMLPV